MASYDQYLNQDNTSYSKYLGGSQDDNAPIEDTQHPDVGIWERFKLKNLAPSKESAKQYLQEHGFEVKDIGESSNFAVRKPGEKSFKKIDPSSFDMQDLTDVLGDLGVGTASTIGAALATPETFGIGTVAGGAAGAAVGETGRQALGRLAGFHEDLPETLKSIGGEAIGGAVGTLGGKALSKGLEWASPTLMRAVGAGAEPVGQALKKVGQAAETLPRLPAHILETIGGADNEAKTTAKNALLSALGGQKIEDPAMWRDVLSQQLKTSNSAIEASKHLSTGEAANDLEETLGKGVKFSEDFARANQKDEAQKALQAQMQKSIPEKTRQKMLNTLERPLATTEEIRGVAQHVKPPIWGEMKESIEKPASAAAQDVQEALNWLSNAEEHTVNRPKILGAKGEVLAGGKEQLAEQAHPALIRGFQQRLNDIKKAVPVRGARTAYLEGAPELAGKLDSLGKEIADYADMAGHGELAEGLRSLPKLKDTPLAGSLSEPITELFRKSSTPSKVSLGFGGLTPSQATHMGAGLALVTGHLTPGIAALGGLSILGKTIRAAGNKFINNPEAFKQAVSQLPQGAGLSEGVRWVLSGKDNSEYNARLHTLMTR